MDKKKYTQIAIEALQMYEKNARTHSPEQVDKIARSIKEFGFINPVLVTSENTIIAGHGRLMAAKQLEMEKVPCLIVDHLTPEQVRAYVIADNKLALDAGWDEELLKEELQALDELDFDISLTGFSIDEFENINTEPEHREDVIEDDFELEIDDEPSTVMRGQIYKLGNHILMCGDSTSADDVSRLMDGQLADCVVTDPPYNVAVKNEDGLTIQNDDLSDKEFYNFLLKTFSCIYKFLKDGHPFYIWYASLETINFYTAIKNSGLLAKEELIWRKNSFTFGRSDYHWAHEPCIYGWKPGAAHYFCESRKESTVIDDFPMGYSSMSKEQLVSWIKGYFENKDSGTMLYASKPIKDDIHPTMKPLKLFGYLVNNSSKKDEIVLDLFGGSGSTLMVCEQLGRKCRMMEYDEKYTEAIINRWESFTGEKAVLING